MSNVPNYRKLSPPEDKDPEDYTWAERRAELYDMIERAGHYRNIERSQRELAARYGVAQNQIHEDIKAINEWTAEHLGAQAEAELETLKNRAVQKLIDEGDEDKAFYLMKNYWETLIEAGVKEGGTDSVEVDLTANYADVVGEASTDAVGDE